VNDVSVFNWAENEKGRHENRNNDSGNQSEQTCKEIESFIRQKLIEYSRDGAVIGLSGGLDSAVSAVLMIRSLGKERVHLLNMPKWIAIRLIV
jgi:NAD+ synthase